MGVTTNVRACVPPTDTTGEGFLLGPLWEGDWEAIPKSLPSQAWAQRWACHLCGQQNYKDTVQIWAGRFCFPHWQIYIEPQVDPGTHNEGQRAEEAPEPNYCSHHVGRANCYWIPFANRISLEAILSTLLDHLSSLTTLPWPRGQHQPTDETTPLRLTGSVRSPDFISSLGSLCSLPLIWGKCIFS